MDSDKGNIMPKTSHLYNNWLFIVLWSLFSMVWTTGKLQGSQEGLSKELIRQMRKDFKMNSHARAVYNAVSNTDIKTLVINRDLLRNRNNFFSNKIDVKGITNQHSSGRCWLFSSLNSIRQYVIKKNGFKSFDFSHNYLSFWDKLEKANSFLEYMIKFRNRDLMDRDVVYLLKDPISDGGYWVNAKDLIQKYGVVPKEVMPETHSSNSTSTMNRILKIKLRLDAAKLRQMNKEGKTLIQLRQAKEKMLVEVYRLLVMNLGEPPIRFSWRYEPRKMPQSSNKAISNNNRDTTNDSHRKNESFPTKTTGDKTITIKNYTPKQFYDRFVGLNLDNYVVLFNDVIHQTAKHYQIRLTRNIYDGQDIDYVNVDMAQLKKIAMKSICDGWPVAFAADVSMDQSSSMGIMASDLYDYESLFDVDLTMTRAQLSLFRQSSRNHGMDFVGVDIKNGLPVKWRVENSWGASKGNSGFWTMYDNWFNLHVFNIIVQKKYVPRKILDIFRQKPIVLPEWDPMI